MSVKFIDSEALAGIAAQLRLTHLRKLDDEPAPPTDLTYELNGPQGRSIARFAWTPKQPGAEIVNSVIPFIAVALAGFALLAAFVLRYMRRTAVAIAAGETRLRHLAMHDPLCGLPNRIFFGERLEAVIDEVRAGSSPAAVFYIDLDHFKDVNDTLGHPVGDELIRNVTLRLSHTLRGDDLVARLGGDEFAVISSIGDDTRQDDGGRPAHHRRDLRALRDQPAEHRDRRLDRHRRDRPAIAAAPPTSCATPTWRSTAPRTRAATAPASTTRRWTRICPTASCWKATCARRSRTTSLRLLYQPIVNKSGETVVGVEALCRWTHPTRGEIPPTEFIAVAEHSGLIIELGAWVLRRACLDGKAWPGLTVSVNVSPLQFRRTDFFDTVRAHAERNRIRSRRGSRSNSPKACCSAMSTPRKPACCG